MTHDDRHDMPDPGAPPLPDTLRWQLRALREERPPSRDLWASIAPRLEPRAASPAPAATRTPWLALAASMLLVVGVAGIWHGRIRESDTTQVALVEARKLSTEYRQALDGLPADAARSGALAPGLVELDRSAAQIRRALARDPDSQLLLEQLRRTYARRLELSQRALVG